MHQTSQKDENFTFTEARAEMEEKDQKWFLGGQDACHVSTNFGSKIIFVNLLYNFKRNMPIKWFQKSKSKSNLLEF